MRNVQEKRGARARGAGWSHQSAFGTQNTLGLSGVDCSRILIQRETKASHGGPIGGRGLGLVRSRTSGDILAEFARILEATAFPVSAHLLRGEPACCAPKLSAVPKLEHERRITHCVTPKAVGLISVSAKNASTSIRSGSVSSMSTERIIGYFLDVNRTIPGWRNPIGNSLLDARKLPRHGSG